MSQEGSTACRLGSALATSLTSIEILPGDGKEWLPSTSNETQGQEQAKEFLLIEGNLGIPQKVLYKAYLQAVPLFTRLRKQLIPMTPIPSLAIETLAWTSSVLILANSGHQTAWNVRKHLIHLQALDPEKELSFTAALLTVRDCAKQSLLWHHRRWVLRQFSPPLPQRPEALSQDSTDDEDALLHLKLSPTRLKAEFDACTVAANTYERNYFAWAHRTRCLDALVTAVRITDKPDVFLISLAKEVANVTLWIERHVADYTAMQYRCRLAFLLHSPQGLPQLFPEASCYSHARSLVESYPEHEALWCYLRGAVSSTPRSLLVNTQLDALKVFVDDYLQTKEDTTRRNACAFHAWLDRCEHN